MKDTETIIKIGTDLDYLKGEYLLNTLWGSRPDGDVEFESLMDYLSNEDTRYMVEHMIKVAREIDKLKGE